MRTLLRFVRWPWELLGLVAFVAMLVVAIQFELLEAFHAFSRRHEDLELDEVLAVLTVTGAMVPVLLWWWKRSLARSQQALREAEAEARRFAFLDPLTGLPNRRALHQRIREEVARMGPDGGLALLLLDLDRFKPVNDLRGHEAGDLLLRAVARRLRLASPEGSVVARLGGDEFVILATHSGPCDLGAAMARHVLRALSEPFAFDGWSATISCSIGVTAWAPGMEAPDLLRQADQAMYRAKQAGRDGYACFDAILGERLRERAELEQDLRAALAGGGIMPYFQPIFDITGRSLRGFEVLARWFDTRRGFVPPDVFIPLAEEMGQIERLSEIVLDRACAALARWPTGLPISLNLSPRQFGDPQLPHRILAILGRHGIPGSRLEIEITERAVLADLEVARRIVQQLAGAGVRISLDDFGTGTSSLAILTQLPIDRIKIDRSFIAGVDRMPEQGKIVSGVLALAQSLGLDVTAEGIERDEELRFLQERHCSLGQGFLLGRPQPAESIERLLAGKAVPLKEAG